MTKNSEKTVTHQRRRVARTASAWLGALTLVLMVGCGDGSGHKAKAPAPVPAEDSPEQKVAQLEASGAIPQLDRLPTLEGVDANGDGVRDDIALHIERTYAEPAQRRAAMQTARAYQRMLLVDKNDAVALEATSEQMMRAIACIGRDAFASESVSARGDQLLDDLEALTTNTKERLKEYLAYNKSRSGSVSVRLKEGNYCE